MASIPNDQPGDELPDIGEMVEAMRAVADAADTYFAIRVDLKAKLEASAALGTSIGQIRALLDRIDTVLAKEPAS